MQSSGDLPDDIESLKTLVIAQRAALLGRDVLIERLRFELARLKRARFGRSSEQLDPQIAQLELTLEELEASQHQATAAIPQPVSPIVRESAVPRAQAVTGESAARERGARRGLRLQHLWRRAASARRRRRRDARVCARAI